MPKPKIYNRLKIAGHLLFWLASIIFMLFFFYYNEQRVHLDLEVLTKAIITNIGFATGVYMNLYVLIPRLLKQKKYIFYIFWLHCFAECLQSSYPAAFYFSIKNILHLGGGFNSFNPNLYSAFFFANLIYVAVHIVSEVY